MRADVTGLRFIDEDHPENLVHAVNSAYLALCSSHQLGASALDDVTKLMALILRCEADFVGKERIQLSPSALRNGGVILCMLGLGGKIRLWPNLQWDVALKRLWPGKQSQFLEKLQRGFQVEVQQKKRKSGSRPKARDRQLEA